MRASYNKMTSGHSQAVLGAVSTVISSYQHPVTLPRYTTSSLPLRAPAASHRPNTVAQMNGLTLQKPCKKRTSRNERREDPQEAERRNLLAGAAERRQQEAERQARRNLLARAAERRQQEAEHQARRNLLAEAAERPKQEAKRQTGPNLLAEAAEPPKQEPERQTRRNLSAEAAERRGAAAQERRRRAQLAAFDRERRSRARANPALAAYHQREQQKWAGDMSDSQKRRELKMLRNRSYTDTPVPGHKGEDAPKTTKSQHVARLAEGANTLTVTGFTERIYDAVASNMRTQKGLLKKFPRSREEKNERRLGLGMAVASDAVGLVPGLGTLGAVGSGTATAMKASGEGASGRDAALRGLISGGSNVVQNLIPVGGTAMSAVNLASDTLSLAAGDETSDPNIYKKLAEHKTQLAMLHSKYLEEGKEPPKELLHVKDRVNRHIELARQRHPDQRAPAKVKGAAPSRPARSAPARQAPRIRHISADNVLELNRYYDNNGRRHPNDRRSQIQIIKSVSKGKWEEDEPEEEDDM